MSVNVNLSAKRDMNLASLKRRFPSVESILAEASLVAVYRYKKKLDSTKYWVKENVIGPLFTVQHSSDSKMPNHSLIILNQEGRNNFSLAVNSISIIIPQEDFLMLRYLNQNLEVSTLALWCQDYKQRDGVINSVCSSLALRIGPVVPCNPYSDHSLPFMETPKKVDKSEARAKLLSIIKPKSDGEFLTDTEISQAKKAVKGKESLDAKANEFAGFSNQTGLKLLSGLNGSSVKSLGEEQANSPLPGTPMDNNHQEMTSPPSSYTNLREIPSPSAPLPVVPGQLYPQQLFQSPMHIAYPPQSLVYENSMQLTRTAMRPLQGSLYDPTPRQMLFQSFPGHQQLAYPRQEGAASYLMSRFGHPPPHHDYSKR